MSFGFSAGDFLAVGKQIKDISSHIRHASASYQALDVELHSLKRALDEIEHIRCPVGQEPAINKVKVTALNCRQLLTDFESKLKKYAILNQQHGAGLGKTRALQKLGRKVEWGIEMEEEAVKLRAAIVAHVGFLNLRLSSLGINASFFAAQKLDEHHEELNRKLGQVRGEVGESRREQAAQGSLIAATSSLILNQVSEIASACIGIIALVSELHSRPPKLDTSHTWFQDPIRFEDAFGRVFPIPSEYGWSKVHAIILDQFATGPGSHKVKSGEYLLYNSLDSKNALHWEHSPLMPGMSITMTLVLGRYGSSTLDRCPRVGCLSFKVVNGESGSKLCSVCRCWFRATSFSIACPLRPEGPIGSTSRVEKPPSGGKKRRQGLSEPSLSNLMQNPDEGQLYKNLSIYTMDLPKTPNVANIHRPGVYRRHKRKPADLNPDAWIAQYKRYSLAVTTRAQKAPIIVDEHFISEKHTSKLPDTFDVNSVNSFLSGDTRLTSVLSIRSAPTVAAKTSHIMPPPLPPKSPCWCRALCSWGGESRDDIGFLEGDLIECLYAGDSSWWVGRVERGRGVVGTFPSIFVEVIHSSNKALPDSQFEDAFGSVIQKRTLSDDSEENTAPFQRDEILHWKINNTINTASGYRRNTSARSQVSSKSVWSGASAGGFSTTSAGSFAQLNDQRTNGALVIHESAQTESFGVRIADKAIKRPYFYAKLLQNAKTRTASSLNQTSNQDSTPISTTTASASEPSTTDRDWLQVRRDVNRSDSPSRHEKLERMERCQMNFPALNPVDELTEMFIRGEMANGIFAAESRNYETWDFDFIDKSVRLIRGLPHGTTAFTLAAIYVCRPYRSDVQRLRAIFTWVAEMIFLEENVVGEMDPPFGVGTSFVIQKKRGSPEDYAILVMEMCAAVGIRCRKVRGHLKTPSEVVDISKPMLLNHWWNVVLVDGAWRIMDCCLASPSNPNRAQYSSIEKGTTDSWWFLTRPTESFWTHVPEGYDQQYVVPPVNTDTLRLLPCASPIFFRNKIELLDFNTSMTRIDDLEIVYIKFSVLDDVEVVAEVELPEEVDTDGDRVDDGAKNLTLAQASWHEGVKRYTVKALLPVNKVQGTLKIYAGQKGLMHSIKDNPYPLAFCLPIVHSGTNEPYEFVTRHPTPNAQRHDIYLVQPQCLHLALNSTFTFAIRQYPSSLPVVDDSESASAFAGWKSGKTAIQTPSGKIVRLTRRPGGRYGKFEGMDDESRTGSVWETIIKCSERGLWRGLVLADRTARWCVFAEWLCI